MSNFDDANWKVNALNHMSQSRVFRSGAIVDIGASDRASKRSVDYFIADLVEDNRIFPAQRGLYFINHQTKPVSPVEIAKALNPGVAVSMESSFRGPSPRGREQLMSHLVVTSGRSGQFKSPLGPYSIHRVSVKLTQDLERELGRDTVYKEQPFGHSSINVFSPTIAYLHICNGNSLSRRGQVYGTDLPTDFSSQINFEVLPIAADIAGVTLPGDIQDILDMHSPSPSP
jgi:hypothetical protein